MSVSVIPGSRVGGIGPNRGLPEGPHHRACRSNTPEEQAGIFSAQLRRVLKVMKQAEDRTREYEASR